MRAARTDKSCIPTPASTRRRYFTSRWGRWQESPITDGVRRINLYVIASSHAKSSLIAVIPDVDFGWVVDLWSPTRGIPGALASHREFVAALRKFGVMPTLWAGGYGNGAAPMKPLVDALDKADKR